jgi:hypothetical protein
MEKMNKKKHYSTFFKMCIKIAPIVLIIILILMSIGIMIKNLYLIQPDTNQSVQQEFVVTDTNDTDDLTPENVWNYIQQIGIQHPHIVYAQFEIQSGTGNSFEAVYQNNLFEMKVPKDRIFVGYPESGTPYASYPHWKYSIIDYAIWQLTYAYNLTEEEYILKLNKLNNIKL